LAKIALVRVRYIEANVSGPVVGIAPNLRASLGMAGLTILTGAFLTAPIGIYTVTGTGRRYRDKHCRHA